MGVRTLFVTRLYEADLAPERGFDAIALVAAARAIAREDLAGRRWSREHAYGGYTSYASLNDLTRRDSLFDDLRRLIDRHVARFSRELWLDAKKPRMESLWINILKPGAAHSGHIHPHSVLSGTVYLEVPDGASAIRFEDPRLPLMMAAPRRLAEAPETDRSFVCVAPRAGTLLLWESFIRHEVPANGARTDRISLSFNYA